MTEQEKQLLIKDLCARLPYGVMIEITSDGGIMEASYDMRLDAGLLADLLHSEDDFKPYLRSMSSLTTEELDEIMPYFDVLDENYIPHEEWCYRGIDKFNKHYVDYRGLIPMGLALEAPEGMYKLETQ